jgi:hypothetical protein
MEPIQDQETDKQRLRRMEQVLNHVKNLDAIDREWLMRRLAEVEGCSTEVGKVWELWRVAG